MGKINIIYYIIYRGHPKSCYWNIPSEFNCHTNTFTAIINYRKIREYQCTCTY